jgi:hypothetical protein
VAERSQSIDRQFVDLVLNNEESLANRGLIFVLEDDWSVFWA